MSFPENIIAELKTSFAQHMSDHVFIARPLRPADPSQSLGVFPLETTPDEKSYEIGNGYEPTLNRYSIRIQNLVVHTNEEDGRELFSVNAKTLRVVLYRDTALRVRLQALTEDLLGTRERLLKYGVTRQRFVNNELNGQWLFVGSTDFWVDTEISQL